MNHALRSLSRSALEGLASALSVGRIGARISRVAIAPHVPGEHLDAVYAALIEFELSGMQPLHIAKTIELLIEERDATQKMVDRVQLVWSPPELDTVYARDTYAVVQELFRRAQRTVLVSTFALDEHKRAETLFGELAARMDTDSTLDVRLFVNIHRKHLDETPSLTLVREFAKRVEGHIWPGNRLPELFYDPRSLEQEGSLRAVLHAKAVVVDARWTLLSSANFTQAAQERNIEAGVLIDDVGLAERVTLQFDRLVESGMLKRLNA